MKKGDVLLIIIAVVFLALWLIPSSEGSMVSIYVDGKPYKKVPLGTDTEIAVESEFGKNTVVIKDEKVSITHADCQNKLCEKDGISNAGRSIVCLPNRLSVIIEGEKSEEEIDVIV